MLIDDALALTSYGFRIHPIRGKVPLADAWPVVATADEREARELFDSHPDATGVGVATGTLGIDLDPGNPTDRLLVLDVDPANGGSESLAAVCAEHGQLPPTVCALTGSGGFHYYYLAPAGYRNTAGRLGRGLDTRGEGGYVAAPPSKHPSGNLYQWAPGFGPDAMALAAAPAWLLERVAPIVSVPRAQPAPRDPSLSGDVYRRASAYIATMPPAVSGSGGHAALFAVTLALGRGFCLSDDDVFGLIVSEYNPRCTPPWSDKEIIHKVDSVAAHTGGPPDGYLLDAPRPDRVPAPAAPAQRAPPPALRVVPATLPLPTSGAAALAPPVPINSRPLTKSYASICQILRMPDLRSRVLGDGRLEFNTLTLEPTLARRALTDADLSRVRELCELEFTARPATGNGAARGIQYTASDIAAATVQVASEAPYHPVAEYLRSLAWDGKKRLDLIAPNILSVNPVEQPLAAELVRRWMISAAARALRPGCKVDTVLVLTGTQGAYKSSFFRTLASPAWFSDSALDIHNKDSLLLLRRVWILEWAELEAMTRARTSESVKAFLTAQVDYLRPPYGRVVQEFPRSCVISGTSNRPEFLADDTGGRRFWPVRVGDPTPGAPPCLIDIDTLARDRDQLWAEAVWALDAGEPWWLDADSADELADEHASHHEVRDAWEEPILEWLTQRLTRIRPQSHDHDPVPATTAELMAGALARPIGQVTKTDADRMGAIVRRAGWTSRTTIRANEERVRAWCPPGRSAPRKRREK